MTTLLSPIDGAPMRKVERYGVELDVCSRSGGVWLDRGELEKIVRLVREEAEVRQSERDQHHGRDDDDFDDDDDRPRRRRSRLLDILDF